VLPVSAICACTTNRACNHLGGDVQIAEPGTPRGAWCAAVDQHYHWILLMLAPALIAAIMVLLSGRRGWLWCSLAWTITCTLTIAQALHIETLRAYPLI
jgi:hypothetical protein